MFKWITAPEKIVQCSNGSTATSQESCSLNELGGTAPLVPGQVPLEDKPCLYDTSLPQCAPVDGKCRDGYGTNENGRCFPQHSKCPDGYHGHEDDESGECIPNKIPCSQGYTVHMSFKDIGAIIRRIDGQANDNDINLSNKSKATQALHLFKNGRKPIDVAIDLDIPYDEVTELEREVLGTKSVV